MKNESVSEEGSVELQPNNGDPIHQVFWERVEQK